ncbi:Smr/MutS family protein, partial [bacterium]|nr:Smr/MutS family protein [bacterium]
VKMGNIITKIPADNLAPYRKDLDNSYKYTKTSKIDDFSLKKHTVSSRFDLRGMRVEDGLNALEMYLDEASLANLNEVIIIHGHGTGAMKQAVRDYFTISPYIKEFRPGNDTEGGDGVSVVAIK